MESTLSLPTNIVSVSEFSQGKTGKIFNDVRTNQNSYMVMKNNNPVAVIIPIDEYYSYQQRINELVAKLSGSVKAEPRIGVAKGEFEVPDDFDEWDVGFGDL
ncbi:MAG: type II toxin-antitoxin system Phd/YefM family antitoxin [Clostridiales bacterium]|nr:type II toxin-antitoxin system Phd/YefM family antitoxin [Clostridiales bacterium]